MKHAQQVLTNLALVAVSLALACGVSELVLRARFGAPPAWTFPQESYVADAALGYALEPDQQAFTHDRPVETNALGLRERDLPPEPPPRVRRLLALGDSQTFGNGLAREDTWPAQLEGALQELGGAGRWEVVNGGLAGTATWQHEILLRRLSEAYAPDAAVLGFYVNDPVPRPEHVEVAVAEMTNSWSKRAAYWLKRSALFVAAWEARHPVRAWIAGRRGSWEQKILTGEADPLVEEGWRQVERSLAAMKRTADARDLALWVLALPRRDQVSGALDARAYQRRLAEICARLGIALHDPLPALQAAYAEHGEALFIPWDGHNAAPANAAVAEGLARAIAGAGRR